MRRVSTLGRDTLDAFLTNYPMWATMDLQRRIYVTLQPPGDLVLTFDTAGRFLGRIGRKGRGPGEFVFPTMVLASERGELLIWDFNAAMLTTLDARHRYVRRHHQASPPAGLLADGRQLVVAAMLDRANVGFPLHFYSQAGQLLGSFGEAQGTYTEAERWRLSRVVAVGARGSVFAAHPDEYVIEEWDVSLQQLRRRFEREVSWMPFVTQRSDGVFGDRPNAKIVALQETDGRLWVYSRVPSETWQSALGAPSQRAGRRATYPNRNEGALYDTIVDVIDLESGRLLVSQRLADHIRFVLRDVFVVAYREEDDGVPLLDVLEVHLDQPGRKQ